MQKVMSGRNLGINHNRCQDRTGEEGNDCNDDGSLHHRPCFDSEGKFHAESRWQRGNVITDLRVSVREESASRERKETGDNN
jgi:hypothetical protein